MRPELTRLERKILQTIVEKMSIKNTSAPRYQVARLCGARRFEFSAAVQRLSNMGYILPRALHLIITKKGILYVYENGRVFRDLE